ncbi:MULTISPECIES: GNAT family N-acetyltransferase [Caproicibacterium]|uniref:GNAT family N-acetyltransferase n=1 Tax=Caproicibacterium argilliputei TaxID=3030016 RepID=A0AA97DB24_9FIRM|nr:GNAT family N-acetyltransferase [Caproicibacterium argilliputei]WOC32350.1 GNAT family N-acetyltransferase [Caproicibacterium argilliputei]
MAGKFIWSDFSQINLNDPFFSSLKSDYSDFSSWFNRKANEHRPALVFYDENGIGAFISLKPETQEILTTQGKIPSKPRLKISTIRIAERFRGQRLGEGALGVCLWKWQESQLPEIYVTVFEKHRLLIDLFQKFGFSMAGKSPIGENIYIKCRYSLDCSNPYACFPFIKPFQKAGIIPINDIYHDKLFPYSELKGNNGQIEEETAGNGVTKIFIAAPFEPTVYTIDEPIFIYRKFSGEHKQYKSVVTSFCTITKIDIIKSSSKTVSLFDFLDLAGNKTVFSHEELTALYYKKQTLLAIQMVYNGFFGNGHNVIQKNLHEQGLFNCHPYQISYSPQQFNQILRMGDVHAENVIIN